MRRGLVHVLAWSLATGAAVTLSWWGVHTVLAGTVYDPPRALPLSVAEATAPGPKQPAPPTSRPSAEQSPPSPGRTPTPPTAPAPSRPVVASPSASTTTAASASASASGQIKSYDTDGGRAVFELGRTSGTLVSATPGAGWSMQVWKTEWWIRVEFTSGADRVSVFCTWHDGPPRVEVGTY
ncbi:hypothetical protein GCM10010269_02090 [Streptomyces humidus]|uniref:Secreted protein n=1 Tax=Streptomyces humidus TaxID=52259 RepID=A0A918L0M9_9ACTN|nr:hypothetical protein [Streptomyces humidus]GGR66935.1 hypothetical protein GCM10010269_02090 [Streptomyces humidus]